MLIYDYAIVTSCYPYDIIVCHVWVTNILYDSLSVTLQAPTPPGYYIPYNIGQTIVRACCGVTKLGQYMGV